MRERQQLGSTVIGPAYPPQVRKERLQLGIDTKASKSVLVIDDDGETRALMEMALEEEGYHVYQAEHGLEGLQVLAQHTPDLIVLDMRMPLINGHQFAHELRAHCGRDVPIVVVTAANDAQQHAQYLGAAGWLAKPFQVEDFVGLVGKCLGFDN